MKRMVSCFLLLSLTACTDYKHKGPDGRRIYGPYGESSPDETHLLMYTVEDFQFSYPGSLAYLRHLAFEAVNDDDGTGEYTIVFLDKNSGKAVLTRHYSVVPDLMFSHHIQMTNECPIYDEQPSLP